MDPCPLKRARVQSWNPGQTAGEKREAGPQLRATQATGRRSSKCIVPGSVTRNPAIPEHPQLTERSPPPSELKPRSSKESPMAFFSSGFAATRAYDSQSCLVAFTYSSCVVPSTSGRSCAVLSPLWFFTSDMNSTNCERSFASLGLAACADSTSRIVSRTDVRSLTSLTCSWALALSWSSVIGRSQPAGAMASSRTTVPGKSLPSVAISQPSIHQGHSELPIMAPHIELIRACRPQWSTSTKIPHSISRLKCGPDRQPRRCSTPSSSTP